MVFSNLLQLDRMLSLYCVGPLMRRKQKRLGSVPILMYHSIAPDTDIGGRHSYYRLTTSPEVFAAQMKFLYEHQYESLGLDSVFQRLARPCTANENNVVAITFDDGFQDFSTTAFPILQRYGFTATVFLPTGYIGNDRRSFMGRNCLVWDEVRALSADGVTFGSHTVTHPQLQFISKKDIRSELLHSKETIEDNLKSQISDFSYPYAFPERDRFFKNFVKASLAECGYCNGVTTRIGTVTAKEDRFLSRRIPVNSHDTRKLFKAKLEGCYDWMSIPQTIFKLIK